MQHDNFSDSKKYFGGSCWLLTILSFAGDPNELPRTFRPPNQTIKT